MANNRRTSKLDQQIDENLRRVYSDAAREPVPERFTRLLEQLRRQTKEKQSDPSGDDS
ncbi:NepR family anti-sigma factor [Roseovarius azorensis]|uniref:NepR family anti-sigma factor n=1 Tax=Roseovarius azorensis TaxID=1287727 RepID=UPI000B84541C|nr:NepR family anti-sigma factor [Roseovarius azorensis]